MTANIEAATGRIELAQEADVARMLEISNWAALHTTANFATEPEPLEPWLQAWRQTCRMHPWLVARDADGAVMGFAKSAPHRAREAYASSAAVSVYLDPGVHGRGLGSALYRELIARLTAQGYVTVIAGVTVGNVASERLHAKLGFVPCGTFHRIGWKFGSWHDVSYWQRHLRPSTDQPPPLRPVAAL